MFHLGLVEETRELVNRGLEGNIVAQQAIGYRQVIEYLRGAHSLNQTIELVKVRTRQFSRRQMTWFRRQLPLRWLELGAQETGRDAAERILNGLAT
jgi:tRNA dimethylallyltransferase